MELYRSFIFVPGNRENMLERAKSFKADVIVVDLEDSVHPDAKDGARDLVRNALRSVDFGAVERMVRINQLPLGLDDLAAVAPERPDLILIPKVETADQVREADALLERIGANAAGGPWLMPILESALGIEQAFEIARSCDRVAALTLGLEDYAADLGVPKSADGDESLYARTRVVNAARAAGVQPIDSVYGQVDDLEGLRKWCTRSARLGYEGMGCLHPRQIPVIHETFRPGEAQIEKALRIVTAFEQARAEGRAVVSLGSKMIDPPVVQQSQRLVERARTLGLLPEANEEEGS